MKAFVFATSNRNHYLYSPGIKKFILIPRDSYEAFKKDKSSSDRLLSKFSKWGYLEEIPFVMGRMVEASEIESAFINTPQIVFEVTTQCNLRCKYCCYGENYETFSNRKSGILKFESAKVILDTISKFSFSNKNIAIGTPLVLSFYGGEPLLNIDLIKKIVDYAKNLPFNNRTLRFSLTTNGLHLAKHICFLRDNNFSLLISLDGDYNSNAYRVLANGGSSFSLLMENLKAAQQADPDYFATFRFNSVYTDRSNVKNLFEFFFTNFGKTPTLSPLHFSDGELISEEIEKMRKPIPLPNLDLLYNYPDAFMEFPIHKKLIQLLMYMTDSLYYNEISFLQSQMEKEHFPTHTCIPFSKRLFLSVDDRILPCEKVNRDHPLAYINKGQININFKDIAAYFNKTVSKYAALCSSCAMEYLCNHCAFSSSRIGGCPNYKSINELEDVYSEVFSYIEDHPNILKSLIDNIILK